MYYCERELTKEDLDKVKKSNSIYVLFSEAQLCGYGIYGAKIVEIDGKHILRYGMGSTCD